ncbi:MAG: PD-(D/E)XK nuclease family protein, partial [Nannocystaceae bacterium]
PDVEKWVRINVARETRAEQKDSEGQEIQADPLVESASGAGTAPTTAKPNVQATAGVSGSAGTPSASTVAEHDPEDELSSAGPQAEGLPPGQEGLPPAGPGQGDVKAPREWLTLLDRYYAEHLHDLQDGPWLGAGSVRRRLAQLHRAVRKLFAPMERGRRPLLDWFEPILDVLRNGFGDIATATNNLSDARAAAACLEISRALGTFSGAAPELQPEVDCTTALRMVLTYAGGLRTPDDPRNGQIEMLGWLELHLDPAPALVIVGVNDGAIPQAITADPFLPDILRSALGVLCNRRRYARDAYLLEAIRTSRAHCTFIAGRSAADGEPLTPSRLLLAGDRDTLPRRVLRLCDANKARRWPLPRGAPPSGARSGFRVPVPEGDVPEISVMAVTEFSWYLRCPYRYWLKYIKRLKMIDDSAVELDAMQFGILGHEVLQLFGQDEQISDSPDPLVIAGFLDETLDSVARDKFGNRPLPAIRIQLARMRARLHAFAKLQSRRRNDGWKIEYCEYTFPEETFLKVPGQEQMRIRGTIDRLDRNERDGSWMIIDYKTGESGRDPERTHRKRVPGTGEKVWSDLQLPLYQHLAVQHGISGRVGLAYINLPKKPENVGLTVAKWDAGELDEAVGTACEIVRNVRAGRFEMADDFPGHFQDDFANICQTGVFGGGDDEV